MYFYSVCVCTCVYLYTHTSIYVLCICVYILTCVGAYVYVGAHACGGQKLMSGIFLDHIILYHMIIYTTLYLEVGSLTDSPALQFALGIPCLRNPHAGMTAHLLPI